MSDGPRARLKDRHPGFGAVAAAHADWLILMGLGLTAAPDSWLAVETYKVLGTAANYLTLNLFGDSAEAGMRVIGGAMLPVGVVLRWSLTTDDPSLTAFTWAWAFGAIVTMTWFLGIVGATLTGNSRGLTAVVTNFFVLRVVWAGTREPLDNPAWLERGRGGPERRSQSGGRRYYDPRTR